MTFSKLQQYINANPNSRLHVGGDFSIYVYGNPNICNLDVRNVAILQLKFEADKVSVYTNEKGNKFHPPYKTCALTEDISKLHYVVPEEFLSLIAQYDSAADS